MLRRTFHFFKLIFRNDHELRQNDRFGMMRNQMETYIMEEVKVLHHLVYQSLWGIIDLYGMTIKITIVDQDKSLEIIHIGITGHLSTFKMSLNYVKISFKNCLSHLKIGIVNYGVGIQFGVY